MERNGQNPNPGQAWLSIAWPLAKGCEFAQSRAGHQGHWFLRLLSVIKGSERRVPSGALLKEEQVKELVGRQRVALGKDARP